MPATFAGRRRNDTNERLGRQFDAIRAAFIKLELPYSEQEKFYKHMRAGWQDNLRTADIQSIANAYIPSAGSEGALRRVRRRVEDVEVSDAEGVEELEA